MRPVFLIIPISAAVIAGAVAFKLTRHYDPPAEEIASTARPAPLFELENQNSQVVRLRGYFGRDKLLIVFYDGSRGPEQSALLAQLRRRYDDLQATHSVVFAISALRPSQNRFGLNLERRRTAEGTGASGDGGEWQYPFPVLSDVRDYEWHRKYGAYDEQRKVPREAVFIVDRAGMIQYEHFGPAGLDDPDDWIRELRGVR